MPLLVGLPLFDGPINLDEHAVPLLARTAGGALAHVQVATGAIVRAPARQYIIFDAGLSLHALLLLFSFFLYRYGIIRPRRG